MIHTAPDVVVVDAGGVRTADVSGRLDVFSSSVLASRVLAGLPTDARELVVDLRALSFVDSGGISALVRLREQARARSLTIRVRLGDTSQLNQTASSLLRRLLPCEVALTDAPVPTSVS